MHLPPSRQEEPIEKPRNYRARDAKIQQTSHKKRRWSELMEGRAARTAMKTARARKRLPQARGGMHGNTLRRLTVRCCRGGSSDAPLRSRAFGVGRAGTASQDDWRAVGKESRHGSAQRSGAPSGGAPDNTVQGATDGDRTGAAGGDDCSQVGGLLSMYTPEKRSYCILASSCNSATRKPHETLSPGCPICPVCPMLSDSVRQCYKCPGSVRRCVRGHMSEVSRRPLGGN